MGTFGCVACNFLFTTRSVDIVCTIKEAGRHFFTSAGISVIFISSQLVIGPSCSKGNNGGNLGLL